MSKWYCGYNSKNNQVEVFKSEIIPTPRTCNFKYLYLFGGYNTCKKAKEVGSYQFYARVVVVQ
jgi:hypothetical protein